jgi:putative nucleotidyltransferase with HDIG domain
MVHTGRIRAVAPHVGSYLLAGVMVTGAFGCVVYLVFQFGRSLTSPLLVTVYVVGIFVVATMARSWFIRLQQIIEEWLSRERYASIEVLKRFKRGAAGTAELETVASSLVTAVANGLKTRGVYLLLPSRSHGGYSTYLYAGQRSRGRLYLSAGSTVVTTLKQYGEIIDNREMETIPSLFDTEIIDREALRENEIELVAPLKNEGHLAGILLIGRKVSGEPYTRRELRLLRAVSGRVAMSIDDANFYEGVKVKQSELQKMISGVVHAISQTIVMTDPYTARHQRRVAELAAAIAREMGLTEWQTMGVRTAGLLHDIGKIAVPTEILNKPGKLDPYEFSIVKGHCRAGYEILEEIDFPWPVARAVLQHHERIDGSGYPLGLTDKDISFEGRILGVADVVEAMASHRPYRPSLGLDAALDEISRGAGTVYDADVVKACIGLLSRSDNEFERIMAAASQEREPLPEPVLV